MGVWDGECIALTSEFASYWRCGRLTVFSVVSSVKGVLFALTVDRMGIYPSVDICASWAKAIFLHEHIWAIGLVVS